MRLRLASLPLLLCASLALAQTNLVTNPGMEGKSADTGLPAVGNDPPGIRGITSSRSAAHGQRTPRPGHRGVRQAGGSRSLHPPGFLRSGSVVAGTRRPVMCRPRAHQRGCGGRTRPAGRNSEELSAQCHAQAGMSLTAGDGHGGTPPRPAALRGGPARVPHRVERILPSSRAEPTPPKPPRAVASEAEAATARDAALALGTQAGS